MITRAKKKKSWFGGESVTLPQGLVFGLATAACIYAFQSIQSSTMHDSSSPVQKASRDREVDELTRRVDSLDNSRSDCFKYGR